MQPKFLKNIVWNKEIRLRMNPGYGSLMLTLHKLTVGRVLYNKRLERGCICGVNRRWGIGASQFPCSRKFRGDTIRIGCHRFGA